MAVNTALAEIYDTLRRGEWHMVRAQGHALLADIPDCAAAHHAIGLSLCGEAAYTDALPHFEQAFHLGHRQPPWARDLGIVYAKVGRWTEAADVLGSALTDLDTQALALFLTASVEAGEADAAVRAIQQLASPDLEQAFPLHYAYGRTLLAASRFFEAETVLQSCLARQPESVCVHEALGLLYDEMNEGDRAFEHWVTYARLRPDSGYAQLRLAMACSLRGYVDQSRDARIAAMRLGLSRPEEYSNALYLMLFDDRECAQSVLSAFRAAFVSPPRPHRAPAQRGPAHRGRRHERLRVGYLSGEFRLSPAYYFLSPFLRNHDRSVVDVFLYNSSPRRDRRTPAYEHLGEHWRDVSRLADDGLLRLVEEDEVDILVDLSGHFPHNRLNAFNRRAVSIQATFPNYPSTTGCSEVDYLFTDIWTSPPGTEADYAERLYRLPSGYLVYAPREDCPGIAPLPATTNGHITFGLFQRFSKMTSALWDAIAAAMTQVPTSRLLLHNNDAELDRPDSTTSRFLRAQFQNRGVDPTRVSCRGPLPLHEHLELLTRVDIAFDTSPYSGHTTTCECLWMGVPVVTLPADRHVSRVSAALLTRAGFGDWVADSYKSYVEIAVALASDLPALTRCRGSLRDQFIARGLTDGRTLARELEEAYQIFISPPLRRRV